MHHKEVYNIQNDMVVKYGLLPNTYGKYEKIRHNGVVSPIPKGFEHFKVANLLENFVQFVACFTRDDPRFERSIRVAQRKENWRTVVAGGEIQTSRCRSNGANFRSAYSVRELMRHSSRWFRGCLSPLQPIQPSYRAILPTFDTYPMEIGRVVSPLEPCWQPLRSIGTLLYWVFTESIRSFNTAQMRDLEVKKFSDTLRSFVPQNIDDYDVLKRKQGCAECYSCHIGQSDGVQYS